jgi:hypothetical protein
MSGLRGVIAGLRGLMLVFAGGYGLSIGVFFAPVFSQIGADPLGGCVAIPNGINFPKKKV